MREKIKDLIYDIVNEWNLALEEEEDLTDREIGLATQHLNSFYEKICLCIDDLYIEESIPIVMGNELKTESNKEWTIYDEIQGSMNVILNTDSTERKLKETQYLIKELELLEYQLNEQYRGEEENEEN